MKSLKEPRTPVSGKRGNGAAHVSKRLARRLLTCAALISKSMQLVFQQQHVYRLDRDAHLVADFELHVVERVERHYRFHVRPARQLDADLAHHGAALDLDDFSFQAIASADLHGWSPCSSGLQNSSAALTVFNPYCPRRAVPMFCE